MNPRERILAEHYYLEAESKKTTDKNVAYLNAYILSNFGIVVDHPSLLSEKMLEVLNDFFHLDIPASYFNNPQDIKYYTKPELFIEQLVSYFCNYGSTDSNSHVKVFDKELPEYAVGDNLKLRKFKIINATEVDKIFQEIEDNYCKYTRPFSIKELENFKYLYNNGYYKKGTLINCKDNIFNLLDLDINFAEFLCGKDIVNYSKVKFGVRPDLKKYINIIKANNKESCFKDIIKAYKNIESIINIVKRGTMTKKQAKYFNRLLKITNSSKKLATNTSSPYRVLTEVVKDHSKALEVATKLSKNGSLLERNLKMILARTETEKDKKAILKLVSDKNPIALYQLMSTILSDTGAKRTFSYTSNNLSIMHVETDNEYNKRQSRLDDETKILVHDTCLKKILGYYKALPKLGKIYIDDEFDKVALPVNTSTSGTGLDILPSGSRVPFIAKNIRTFVHWKDAFDIDSALSLIDTNGQEHIVSFWNYAEKEYGDDLLFSGDCTAQKGAEFWDINLDGLKKRGIRYIIQSFHGYCSKLNKGEIYCGYQDVDNLDTKAWNPKNISLQFRVIGDTRACAGFALDLETNEIVILNTMIKNDSRIADGNIYTLVKKVLDDSFLTELNMKKIISLRGTKVKEAKDADYIFSSSYTGELKDNQKLIKPYDIEKLVGIINE